MSICQPSENAAQNDYTLNRARNAQTKSQQCTENNEVHQNSAIQGVEDSESLVDSAFYSEQHTTRTVTSSLSATNQNSQSSRRSKKIPGTDLLMFPGGIDDHVRKHYHRIRPEIEGLLMDELSTENRLKDISTRLLRIGKTEEEAYCHLVIFCQRKAESTVRRVLQEPHVTPFFKLRGQNVSELPIKIVPNAPEFKSGLLDIDVTELTTFCGSKLMLKSRSGLNLPAVHRQATSGGIIKANFGDGTSQIYGMTAGHAVKDILTAETTPTQVQKSMYGDDEDFMRYRPLGSVLDPSTFPGVAAGCARPTHDWALFSVESFRPNLVTKSYQTSNSSIGEKLMHEILVAKRPVFEDGLSDPVLLSSGIRGVQRGELSNASARIWIEESNLFIDAYIMDLEDGYFCDGDSGSWVVHNMAPEFYGHMIATDAFGGAYIVPSVDTLDNIRDCLGAISVQLPDKKDSNLTHKTNPITTTEIPKWSKKKKRSPIIRLQINCPPTRRKPKQIQRQFKIDHHSRVSEKKVWNPVWFDRITMTEEALPSVNEWPEWQDNPLEALLGCAELPNSEKYEEIREFCGSQSDHSSMTPSLARAWLDDRESATGCRRRYPPWLTPDELRECLQFSRFGSDKLPNVDRRLIYISLVDPQYIVALAETIRYGDREALRDAIYRHLTCKTMLQVNVPLSGRLMFQLRFHLSFLALRPKIPAGLASKCKNCSRRQRLCKELSFMGLEPSQLGQQSTPLVMQERQFSIVVHGYSERQWTAYCFDDAGDCDHEQNDAHNLNIFDDEESDDDEFDSIIEDQIVGVSNSGGVLDANQPIWSPREYWLTVVHYRTGRSLEEWTYLVRKFESSTKLWNSRIPMICADNASTIELKQTFEWNTQALILLNQLRDHISRAVTAFERFLDPDGDISYLSDIMSRNGRLSIDGLKVALDKFIDLRQSVIDLDLQYMKTMQILGLRLNVESNKLHCESVKLSHTDHKLSLQTFSSASNDRVRTERTTRLLVALAQILIPIAIAFQVFGLLEFLGFERNWSSFVISIIVVNFIYHLISLGLFVLVQVSSIANVFRWLNPQMKAKQTNCEKVRGLPV